MPCTIASLTEAQMTAGNGVAANEGRYPRKGEEAPAARSTPRATSSSSRRETPTPAASRTAVRACPVRALRLLAPSDPSQTVRVAPHSPAGSRAAH